MPQYQEYILAPENVFKIHPHGFKISPHLVFLSHHLRNLDGIGSYIVCDNTVLNYNAE